jgi:two-component system, OmpR family, sensor histidine kinase KdpD
MTGTPARARLKVFLGYAAGVGKTYQMLGEARKLKAEGVDVVVGYFEPHGRADTMALVEGLETVPRQVVEYKGARLEEMDTAAVLGRHPRLAVVDEFAHTNAPGSARAKRWEDVHALLDAGIDVFTTMNVQHLESLNDQIWQSTGVRVRETVPDWVLQQADEVVMVDLTPSALINRLRRGAVYPPERARAALDNFFRESTLVALREMAMRQAAYVLDSRLPAEDLPAPTGTPLADAAVATERLLLLIGPEPSSAALIRRGRRVADYLRADCLAVYVTESADLGHLSRDERDRLERHLNFARALQIDTRVVEGRDVADAVAAFARLHGVTQIFVTRPGGPARRSWLVPSLPERIVNRAAGLQVTIVADRSRRSPSTAASPRPWPPSPA